MMSSSLTTKRLQPNQPARRKPAYPHPHPELQIFSRISRRYSFRDLPGTCISISWYVGRSENSTPQSLSNCLNRSWGRTWNPLFKSGNASRNAVSPCTKIPNVRRQGKSKRCHSYRAI
ncbi:unnamed protein product [Dicrocoelium dendriticum]|nr:unnamed protein product [Dicrocoelium dendriticum]